MKFIATNRDKIASIPVTNGQLIFSRDERAIYLDVADERVAYHTIIVIATEDTRTKLISPVQGFYFVEETAILYRLTNNVWTALTEKPEERIIFVDNTEPLPIKGEENKIYISEGILYQWSDETNSYAAIGGNVWQPIK